MPGLMFQDVVCPRARSPSKWYSVPLSFLVHTFVLTVIVVLPVIATDVLPMPRTVMEFVTPYVPVVPSAPPPRRVAPLTSARGATGAPVVAPETIGAEPGIVFQPGDVDTTGIENIVGGFNADQMIVDAPPVVAAAPPKAVVVGGNIKPPARTKYVAPQYPEIARSNRVEGMVIIEAVIGTDGTVEQARVLRSKPLLDEAALAAVKAWEYTPTLLNGRATPVIMTVTVVFKLR